MYIPFLLRGEGKEQKLSGRKLDHIRAHIILRNQQSLKPTFSVNSMYQGKIGAGRKLKKTAIFVLVQKEKRSKEARRLGSENQMRIQVYLLSSSLTFKFGL